jgi:hypothetical protein
LDHEQVVTEGENFRLQGGTGPKTGGDAGKKGDEKRFIVETIMVSRNARNLCVFRSDKLSVRTPDLPSSKASRPSKAV